MEQIKSYLSLQESVGKVLIVGDEQWEDTLARYLQRSGKAAGICRLTQQERESLRRSSRIWQKNDRLSPLCLGLAGWRD